MKTSSTFISGLALLAIGFAVSCSSHADWDRGGGGWGHRGRGGGGWGHPGPGYPAPGPGYPAPGPGYPAPGPGYPAPGPGYPAPGPGYPAPGPGYPAPGQPCNEPLIPVYRFNNGFDHFLTLNPNDGYSTGYRYEGLAFSTFQNWQQGRAQIFRCYSGRDHFVSTDPYCEGRSQEGAYGWVSPYPTQEAQRQIVRCVLNDHLATTNINECYQAGYRVEMVLGYVP